MEARRLPSNPPARRPQGVWYPVRNPRRTRKTLTNTQTITRSGTQIETGRDTKVLRDEDTAPGAVDMATSADSMTLSNSDGPLNNVSPRRTQFSFKCASSNVTTREFAFFGAERSTTAPRRVGLGEE